MSLFNISLNSSYNIPKATWNTGNLRDNLQTLSTPQPSQHPPICTNYFSNNSNICDVRKPNDRFSSYGFIKSSKLNSLSNNNNLPDIFANFENSYNTKIRLAKHYKPIKN